MRFPLHLNIPYLPQIQDRAKKIFCTANLSYESSIPEFWKYLILIIFFIITRTAVLWYRQLLGGSILINDAGNYLRLAQYIQGHWILPIAPEYGARQFAGMSILIALCNTMLHNIILSGFLVTWMGSLASILLFHFITRDFRMSLIFVVFIPHWVPFSASVSSEGLSIFLCLVAVLALTLKNAPQRRRNTLLFIAGFAPIVRLPAALFIYVFIIVAYIGNKEFKISLKDYAFLSLPMIIYLCWTYFSTGHLIPQLLAQSADCKQGSRGYFYPSLFYWPGYSLMQGLLHPAVYTMKKINLLGHLGLIAIVARNLIAPLKDSDSTLQNLKLPFLVILIAYVIFILSFGGPAFFSFERYMVQINPIIVYGLFRRCRIKWYWIFILTVIAIIDGTIAGRGTFRY